MEWALELMDQRHETNLEDFSHYLSQEVCASVEAFCQDAKTLLTNEQMSLEQLAVLLKGSFEEAVLEGEDLLAPFSLSKCSNFIKFRIIPISQ